MSGIESHPSTGSSMGVQHVAPLLPATAPVPEPARRIGLPGGLILYWLMPRRYGPHLAAGAWWRAILAHLLGLLGVAGATGWYLLANLTKDRSTLASLEELRIAAATLVLELAAEPALTKWMTPLRTLGAVPAMEFLLIGVAIFFMPWCAGGDRAGSVFKRSLRNVYWASSWLLPMGLLFGWLYPQLVQPRGWFRELSGEWHLLIAIVSHALAAFLLLRALLAGASRYVGPAEGPAFSPREPLCDDCGYRIIGLPLEGRCPECGTLVAESLPGGRRQPTIWQQCELRPRGFVELWRMQWRINRDPDFFRRLPVHEGLTAARHFWWGTFALMALVQLVATRVVIGGMLALFSSKNLDILGMQSGVAPLAVVVPLVLQALLMFLGCRWAQFKLGVRDYRVSAIACYYASPMMWPVLLAAFLGFVVTVGPIGDMLRRVGSFYVLGFDLDGQALAAIAAGAAVCLMLGRWWLRLTSALRHVQYANV